MQFSAVYGMVMAFALGVAAHGAPSVHQDKTQCPGDQISCCINKSDIKGGGILDNLLSRGLIHDLLGASDQACAKTDLIGEINILGTTKDADGNHKCSGQVACCPGGGKACNAI